MKASSLCILVCSLLLTELVVQTTTATTPKPSATHPRPAGATTKAGVPPHGVTTKSGVPPPGATPKSNAMFVKVSPSLLTMALFAVLQLIRQP